MVVLAPCDGHELAEMLRFAVGHVRGRHASPIAIRYPRGSVGARPLSPASPPIELGKAELLADGDDVAFLAVGSMVTPALDAARTLASEGVIAAVVNARFVKPLDRGAVCRLAERTRRLVICEENSVVGGFGAAVHEALASEGLVGVETLHFGVPDRFIEHGSQSTLRSVCHLTAQDFAAAARELVGVTAVSGARA
jgi:1-deoxy-D-xylulose-5-phosphate synthase